MNKHKITHLCSYSYYYPGMNYAEKLLKKENRFFEKMRDKRMDQIINENYKFNWSKENKEKILKVSDFHMRNIWK